MLVLHNLIESDKFSLRDEGLFNTSSRAYLMRVSSRSSTYFRRMEIDQSMSNSGGSPAQTPNDCDFVDALTNSIVGSLFTRDLGEQAHPIPPINRDTGGEQSSKQP